MRRKIEINENWFFTKERPNLTAPDFSAMQEITLPHTWNAEDGADGDDYYDRRECWYVRKLERPQGDEIYLEVPAASQTAHVYLNGAEIGHHIGGFSLFRIRLTERLEEKENILAINLLFHASIPMNPDGTFKSVRILGQDYKGRALLDRVDQLIRTAYFKTGEQEEVEYAHDYIWYLWGGKDSPLFDKSKMATFERAFIEEAETHKEEKGAYYTLREQEEICDKILDEFGVTGMHRHIINGHVPVRSNQGENPIKANGKMLVIDGGFSRPYHLETGIAGYTLVYHSRGFQLVQHEPFESRAKAIEEGLDIKSTTIDPTTLEPLTHELRPDIISAAPAFPLVWLARLFAVTFPPPL